MSISVWLIQLKYLPSLSSPGWRGRRKRKATGLTEEKIKNASLLIIVSQENGVAEMFEILWAPFDKEMKLEVEAQYLLATHNQKTDRHICKEL